MIPYHQIATRFYNRPLLLAPSNAQAISGFLYSRIAADLVPRADVKHAPRVSGFIGSYRSTDGRSLPYRLTQNGVAIIEIVGELVNRGTWVESSSGLVSYEGIKHQCSVAESDPEVKVALIDMECPGGEAIGCFDAAAAIRRLAAVKPVIGVVNGMSASGGYALLSGATRIISIDEGLTGSIGVVMVHFDFSAYLESEGVKPTLIYAGAHKVDGNPFEPLPANVRGKLQAEVEQMYGMFVGCVSAGRPRLTDKAIRATEAEMFFGQDAVRLRLVDEVSTFEDVVARLSTGDPLAAFAGGDREVSRSVHAQRVSRRVQEEQTMEPCKTCGAESCQCGDKCTGKACGCCDACTATASSGEGESKSTGTQTTTEDAQAKTFFAMVRDFFAGGAKPASAAAAAQDPEKVALRAQLQEERTARVNAEVTAILGRNASKLGRDAKAGAEKLLRSAMNDPAACAKTLAADLTAFIDSLPAAVTGSRIAANGDPDAAADEAINRTTSTIVGEDEGNESRNLDRDVRQYMRDNKLEHTAENYRAALDAVTRARSATA